MLVKKGGFYMRPLFNSRMLTMLTDFYLFFGYILQVQLRVEWHHFVEGSGMQIKQVRFIFILAFGILFSTQLNN